MLEHVPHWLGHALSGVRAGHSKLLIVQQELALGDHRLDLSSPAFADGARLPVRFTADGAGISPPLLWSAPPPGTAALVLLVEDPDAPAPSPLVHALICDLPADAGSLPEGAIGAADGENGAVGRNSFGGTGWLPPDPPTGHGPHDYVFQLFALAKQLELGGNPGRGEVARAIAGRVLAAGMLVGTYSRGEESGAEVGPALAPA